ncbi:MAG: hypothetical protein H0T15_04175 [Thermoleophilaceae bacterium]|nr:hypothetical protein [Thermoleophilaceae bacterium]
MKRPLLLAAALLAAVPAASSAAIFGTNPINISVPASGDPADGPSGGAAMSGDDRSGRNAAFHSDATNLVGGDTNGQRDVFLWTRPNTPPGAQNAFPSGGLERVSVSSGGQQGDGASQNPSVDGSLRSAPKCVAFESTATNLAAGDASPDSDIFVRNFKARSTTLVSGGVPGAATNPSIQGNCGSVVFESGGSVFQGKASGGSAKKLGGGSNPDISLDGSAIAWESGGGVTFRRAGKSSKVRGASAPQPSDKENGTWGLGYEKGSDVFLGVFKSRGGQKGSANASGQVGGDAKLAGVSAFAANRGIVTFWSGNSLFDFNKNSGGSDDLANATSPIKDAQAGARANFDVFTAASGDKDFLGDGNGGVDDVWFKSLPQ